MSEKQGLCYSELVLLRVLWKSCNTIQRNSIIPTLLSQHHLLNDTQNNENFQSDVFPEQKGGYNALKP